ncbi:MAG TPA: DUF983 domain-containing protein [Bacteroidia bacterium]|nr:DUF983 domain-containing protein [Bacteroidia bacterium]HNP99136.1 DUF983 domain-containing protein [Bacteroidia bacterium]
MTNSTVARPSANALSGIVSMKCPACRTGNIFVESNPYVLSKMGEMHENCSVCGESFRHEPGFYFGAAYVSYALMVAFLVGVGLLYYAVFREIGDHMFRLLVIGTISAVMIAPLIFRYSRIIYLYIIVRYKGKKKKS